MAKSTHVADGIHIVRASGFGAVRVLIPEDVAAKIELTNGRFVGVMQAGPIAVVCPVHYVTESGLAEEMRRRFMEAINAFYADQKAKAQKVPQ